MAVKNVGDLLRTIAVRIKSKALRTFADARAPRATIGDTAVDDDNLGGIPVVLRGLCDASQLWAGLRKVEIGIWQGVDEFSGEKPRRAHEKYSTGIRTHAPGVGRPPRSLEMPQPPVAKLRPTPKRTLTAS